MKIIHMCLSCFYIDGYKYQENELVKEHVDQGHEVLVIASTENYDENQKRTYSPAGTYIGTDGAQVIRLAYSKLLPQKIMKKLRMHSNVYKILEKEKPDIVMFHGLCGWELRAAAKYKENNPDIIFHVDSHEDKYNSAMNFVSRNFLHKLYYRYIIKSCLKNIDKVLCLSLEIKEFVNEHYGIPRDKLEFYPLGGRVFSDEEYKERRTRARNSLGVGEGQVLILQTGKMGERKKLVQSLRAFSSSKSNKLTFVIAGSLSNEIEAEALRLIDNDERVKYLGWQTSDEILDLLCAADVYLQPGTQSVTMQMSLCARCPVILDDVLSHQPYVKDNGWLINSQNPLENIFSSIEKDSEILKNMSRVSYEYAKENLDYKNLAKRILK